MPLLDVRDVVVRFGGVMAVDRANVHAAAGKVTGLIGPNGAGKTTLFNVITGVQPPTSGMVLYDGDDITDQAPHRRARLGMARTFQRLELFWTLSVRDNVLVAAGIAKRDHPNTVVDGLLDRLGIGHLADQVAGQLPTGSARLVEVARALALSPRLLLLDEPASGLDELETIALGHLLRELVTDGLAIMLVEHDMSLVMEVCDEMFVLDLGHVIASGTPDVVKQHQGVLDAYLGSG